MILFNKDFYKVDHRRQYPENTTKVYSNFTARISRIYGVDKVVVFGIYPFLKELNLKFKNDFFDRKKNEVISQYKRMMDNSLGKDSVAVDHLEKLHDLQYLPLHIKALDEGTVCPLKVPILTITNTLPDFSWLPNFLETYISASLWHPITSATIAREYKNVLSKYAEMTSDIPEFVQWQGHDFSMRGQVNIEAATLSGAAHLLSFTGTDTINAIHFLENNYRANSDKELIGGSVTATEHAVMCLGGQETELQTYERLITKVYPSGIVSIVSDTWDFWKVLTDILPTLKSKIMAREGKVVIRPDSGDPETILCGDKEAPEGSPAYKGALILLWELFGGTINSKGFKQLDQHIGLIYGDSITLERCKSICERMKKMGFASTNMVFGIGSYTYQYVTRDTLGFAMKATYGEIDGKSVEIFKDPLTDKGVKKSAKGLLKVNDDLTLSESVSSDDENTGLLKTVFYNGEITSNPSLFEIRKKLSEYL